MSDEFVLLIDNSNTRTKFRLGVGDLLCDEQRILATRDISEETVATLLEGWTFHRVILSSVVPEKGELLCRLFDVPVHSLSAGSVLNFSLDGYAGKSTIGADRLANAAGLATYGRLPAIVVDMGTAVTYEVLCASETGVRFAGGVIAAGLSTLVHSLNQATAQLPLVRPSVHVSVLGQDTAESLRAGALYGYAGMLRETLSALEEKLGEAAFVVLTGGDAAFVLKYDESFGLLDNDITMRGLLLISSLN